MEREVGEGIGTGKPMAVSFQCMTKFATKKRIKEEISKKKKKYIDLNPNVVNIYSPWKQGFPHLQRLACRIQVSQVPSF